MSIVFDNGVSLISLILIGVHVHRSVTELLISYNVWARLQGAAGEGLNTYTFCVYIYICIYHVGNQNSVACYPVSLQQL